MNVKCKINSALSLLKNHLSSMTKDSIKSHHILSDIDTAIVKSSGGGEHHPDDKYVSEILFLVSNSPSSITFLARRLSARLESSRDNTVAIKTLTLLHRLLRGGDRFFEQNLRILWWSGDLRITLHHTCDPFVVSYSLFLQERMGWLINQAGKLEPVRPPGFDRVRNCKDDEDVVLYNVSRCQVFLDRVVECSPNRGVLQSQLMAVFVLNIIVKESFQVYETLCDGIERVIASFFNIRHGRFPILGVLRRVSMQTPKLHEFYESCKRAFIMGMKNVEYPSLRTYITDAEISSMEDFAEADKALDYKGKMMMMKKKNAIEEEGLEMEIQVCEGGGGFSLSQKLETKISTVWVEFDEGEGDPLTLC